MQYTRSNNRMLAIDYTPLDITETENDMKLKKEAQKITLPRMVKVHNVVRIWQGSHTLCAIQNESSA